MSTTLLRRRSIRADVPAAPSAETPVSHAPRLRLRVANNAASRAQADRSVRNEIDEQLQLIASLDIEIDQLMEKLQGAHAKIEKLMSQGKINDHSDGNYNASIVEVFSRQKTVIDPKRFKAQVGEKEFWACVEVPVGKAEEILGKKELARISDVTPGKSTGYQFKLKKVEAKKV